MEEFKEQWGGLLEEKGAVERKAASGSGAPGLHSARREQFVPVATLAPYQFPGVEGIPV